MRPSSESIERIRERIDCSASLFMTLSEKERATVIRRFLKRELSNLREKETRNLLVVEELFFLLRQGTSLLLAIA